MSEYRALSAMEKRINEQYHRLALKLGLSDSVLSVLYCLTEQETGNTQNTIAQRMGLPKQTVNSAITKLIKDDWVRLKQLPFSGNVKEVLLTEQGRTYCSRHIRPILQAEERAFHRMTPEEQAMFFRLARKYEQYFTDGLAALAETMQEDEQ